MKILIKMESFIDMLTCKKPMFHSGPRKFQPHKLKFCQNSCNPTIHGHKIILIMPHFSLKSNAGQVKEIGIRGQKPLMHPDLLPNLSKKCKSLHYTIPADNQT